MNGLYLSWGDLICLCFAIGLTWGIFIWVLLHFLEKIGLLRR